MAQPSSSIRVTTRRALVDLLTQSSALDGVDVRYGPPAARSLQKDTVFIGRIRGNVEPVTMRAGRKDREDVFRFEVWCVSRVGGDDEQGYLADQRCEELYTAIDDIVAGDPSLGGVSGLLWCFFEGTSDGPSPFPIQSENGAVIGWGAEWQFEITCHARLQ